MTLEVIFVLFWLYSFLGWVMETILVSIQSKKFINRGFFLGPYCPIYGTGGVLLLTLHNYQSSPMVVFILAIFICSIVEYLTSYILELIYKIRWWDYSNRFFNVNGRICLFNSVCFGVLGMIVVCYLNPFFVTAVTSLNSNLLHCISLLVLIVTLTDIVLTTSIMFDVRKLVVNFKDKTLTNLFKQNTDNTEEISQKVRSILKEKTLVHKHLSKAYANLRIYKNNFLHKTEDLIKHRKGEKIENTFVLSSLISILIGIFLGRIFNNVGLLTVLAFSLNCIIVHYISRGGNGKR